MPWEEVLAPAQQTLVQDGPTRTLCPHVGYQQAQELRITQDH